MRRLAIILVPVFVIGLMFSLPNTAPAQRGSLQWCLNYYCSMCARSINLLGQSTSRECQNCKNRKWGMIQRCARGGSSGSQQSNQAKIRFCRKYARYAVNQYRLNITRRCGYRGSWWNPNYSDHFRWCMRVPTRLSVQHNNRRVHALRRCGVR